MPPILAIGLDGACPRLIRRWVEAGELPALGRLMRRGTWGALRSTVPPATFPAWSTFMTGLEPGRHGVFDFTRRVPGTYRVEFVNSTYRRGATLWRLLGEAGQRVGVMGVPGTYPPEPVNGFLIAGFDSPVTTGIDSSFVHPPELYRELTRAVGPYRFTDFQELRIGRGWHDMALPKLLEGVERHAAAARYLWSRERWDFFMAMFGESDTVAHHFWMFCDPDSPRYDRERASVFGDAILQVYRALDRAVGELVELAGEDAHVAVVSDHGSGGASDRVLYLNRRLQETGLLGFVPSGAGPATRITGWVKSAALQLVPYRMQEKLFRRGREIVDRLESASRFGAIDWSRTRAFSEELNYFPSVWIHLRGRDPLGTVEPGEDYERTRDAVARAMLEWVDPEDGRPLVQRVLRREEVFEGPEVEHAPDLVVEPALRGEYLHSCLPSGTAPPGSGSARVLTRAEHVGAKGRSMNGNHRSLGFYAVAGPAIASAGRHDGPGLADLVPTLLYLAGVEAPSGLDGRVPTTWIDPSWVARHPLPEPPEPGSGSAEAPDAQPYDEAENEAIYARLKSLGYLE